MFSHISVGSNNLVVARDFYNAALLPLGLKEREVIPDGGPPELGWVHPDNVLPRFYVYQPFIYQPFNQRPATMGHGTWQHGAFLAPSQEAVVQAYQAGLANGRTDEGPPGLRESYGVGYFGADLRSPDSNKGYTSPIVGMYA